MLRNRWWCRYKVVPSISGRSEAFLGVALRAADVARSEDYWVSKPAATRNVRLIGAVVCHYR